MSNKQERISDFFDPDGCEKYPAITAVEIYLGGIGRLVFPDGTVQFAHRDTYPNIICSPRLSEPELELFCKENLAYYEKYYEMYEELFDRGDFDKAPPIERFWGGETQESESQFGTIP